LIFFLGALFLAGLSVSLALRAVVMPRLRAAETVESIGAYGFTNPRTADEGGAGVRGFLDDVANLLGGAVAHRFGGVREAELRNELMAAGLHRMAPRKFLGYRILCTACVPAAWTWVAVSSAMPAAITVLGTITALLMGWVAPITIVRKRARRRLQQIDHELPELIDLLIVTVEAGLGFNSSLQIAGDRLRGPVGEEIRLTLQEQSMGLSTNEALRNLLARAETPAMRSFVRAIIQGETLGVSIGEIMRTLAAEMRKRRRASAEERAQKAPIKILFPLIFLIFPAMFVILLGPAAFQFIEAFGGGS
jgi:tight adherence protein C